MTINEHVNAIYSAIPNLSKDELTNLRNSLDLVMSDIRNKLNIQKHLQTHHSCSPNESNK